MKLVGPNALVIGGSQGIGYAIAGELRRNGAAVTIMARRENVVEEAVQRLRAEEGDLTTGVFGVTGDVSNPDDVARVVEQASSLMGSPPQILVNSAGIGHLYRLMAMPVEAWDEIFQIHSRGVFLSTQAVSELLVKSGLPGSIVNITSLNWHSPTAGLAHYCAAKAAATAFTQVSAIELAEFGIRVNSVAPGIVVTPMVEPYLNEAMREGYLTRTPMGRLGKPTDVARVVASLCSEDWNWVTGASIPVDGGAHMMGLHNYADAFGLPK